MSLTIHVFMSWLTSASWCWPFMSWLRGIFMHPIISSSFDQTGFSRIFCGWLVFFRVIHSVWSRSPKLLFFLLGEKNNLPAAKHWVQKTSSTVAVHPHKRRHMIDGISQTATEGREVWWLSWYPRRWWQAPRPTPTESVCNWRIFRNAWPVGLLVWRERAVTRGRQWRWRSLGTVEMLDDAAVGEQRWWGHGVRCIGLTLVHNNVRGFFFFFLIYFARTRVCTCVRACLTLSLSSFVPEDSGAVEIKRQSHTLFGNTQFGKWTCR